MSPADRWDAFTLDELRTLLMALETCPIGRPCHATLEAELRAAMERRE